MGSLWLQFRTLHLNNQIAQFSFFNWIGMWPLCPWPCPLPWSWEMLYSITQCWRPSRSHPCIQEYKSNRWVPDPLSLIPIKQTHNNFLVASGIHCGAAACHTKIVFVHCLCPSWSQWPQHDKICYAAASARLDYFKNTVLFPRLWWFSYWYLLGFNWNPQQHSI